MSLTTTLVDRTIQLTPVWSNFDGTYIYFNSEEKLHLLHSFYPGLGADIFFEAMFALAQTGKANVKGEVNLLHLAVMGGAADLRSLPVSISPTPGPFAWSHTPPMPQPPARKPDHG